MQLHNLAVALTQPLYAFEEQLLRQREEIEIWFNQQWDAFPPPLYGSVDLRNAGFKLAPVDMNLFPAGFNNLNPQLLSSSIAAAQKVIRHWVPQAKRILIIPENHTRNLFYWESIHTLQRILEHSGFQVRIGFLLEELTVPSTIALSSGAMVTIEPLRREQEHVFVDGFIPDFILLNNDLADGVPTILQGLTQVFYPPAELGWHQRLKSEHFQYYAEMGQLFAEKMQIDPWAITPLFRHRGNIDFMRQEGLECLLFHAEALLADINKKYQEYAIPHKPFLIIKADAGTYGMAVMTVRSLDDLQHLNREQRKRMASTKGNQPVRRVILQEGVYSFETYGTEQAVAEPVVYLWGGCVVGGFYRVHQARGIDESLNAPGAHFKPLAFSHSCDAPEVPSSPQASSNLLYAYGIVARLSMLAAAREVAQQSRKALWQSDSV